MKTNKCTTFRQKMALAGMITLISTGCSEKIVLEDVTIDPNDIARIVTLDGDKDEDNVAIYKGLFGEKEVPSGTMAVIIQTEEGEKKYFVILEGGKKIITEGSGKIYEDIQKNDIAEIGIVPEGQRFYIKVGEDKSIAISAGTEVRILEYYISHNRFSELEDLVEVVKDGQTISGLMKNSDMIKLEGRETQTYLVEDIRIFTLRKGTEVDGTILEEDTNFFGSDECSTEHEKFIFLPNGQGLLVPADRVKETMKVAVPTRDEKKGEEKE